MPLDFPQGQQDSAGFDGFLAAGLPNRRLEGWRWSDLHGNLKKLPPSDGGDLPDSLPGIDRRLILDGGEIDDSGCPPGMHLSPGDVAVPVEEIGMRAISEFNAANARGVVMEIDAGVDAGVVHLMSVPVGGHGRLALRLAEGAHLTLLETPPPGQGRFLTHIMDVSLATGAVLTHLRLEESINDVMVNGVFVRLAANARYESVALDLDGKFTRAETRVTLEGEGASAQVGVACLADGDRLRDTTVVMNHVAPGCVSDVLIKSVLDGAAHGVFQGLVNVADGAQKSDGRQMTQALLLSPKASMQAKPELTIHADDVQCAHGSGIGGVNPDALFYLRSRGLDESAARRLLVQGMLRDVMDRISDEKLRAIFERRIEERLGGEAS